MEARKLQRAEAYNMQCRDWGPVIIRARATQDIITPCAVFQVTNSADMCSPSGGNRICRPGSWHLSRHYCDRLLKLSPLFAVKGKHPAPTRASRLRRGLWMLRATRA